MKYILVGVTVLLMSLNLVAGEKMRSEKLHNYYTKLNLDNMEILKDFYTDDVQFIDPVGELKGVDAVYEYTKKMYQAATSVKFVILDEVISGDTHVIRWKMDFQSKSLNGGESIIVPGISWVRFRKDTDKAEFHEDSFDVGAMVYEHVPMVGFFVRSIKNKFKH
jgi:ketosteroid isomerase-like protein